MQEATGESVEVAYVDQGYTGEQPAREAAEHGINLEVVKHQEAKRGFVLLPRRWVIERGFAWASRFRRLVKDYERLPETVAGLHFVAFACLFLHRAISIIGPCPSHALGCCPWLPIRARRPARKTSGPRLPKWLPPT